MMSETRIGMLFLKLLLGACLVFNGESALSCNYSQTLFDYRLPTGLITVEHYRIALELNITENIAYNGTVDALFHLHNTTKAIALHADALEIDERETQLTNRKTNETFRPYEHIYCSNFQALELKFFSTLPEGVYSVLFKFKSPLYGAKGFTKFAFLEMKSYYPIEETLFTTKFQPTGTRQLFPCWDEPALKARFTFKIKYSSKYEILSNAPQYMKEYLKGDERETLFDSTPLMSTYSVAIIVIPISFSISYIPLEGYCRTWDAPGLKLDLIMYQACTKGFSQFFLDIVKEMASYTNSTTAFLRMDHVVMPGNFKCFQSWGLMICSEEYFAYEKEEVTCNKLGTGITRGLAHQLFSNLISPSWWTDAWLNEGLSLFFQYYIFDKVYPMRRMMEFFVVEFLQPSFYNGIDLYMNPITDFNTSVNIDKVFPLATHNKTPFIMRMMQHMITEEMFQKGIINYINKYQFKSATTDDFWKSMQDVMDEPSFLFPNKWELYSVCSNIKNMMTTWLKEEDYPVVNVTRGDKPKGVYVSQINLYRREHTNWWIPLTYTTQSTCNFSRTSPQRILMPNKGTWLHNVDTNEWIILNIQQVGYYRVKYDDENWQKIANYLKHDTFQNIHVLNRAQIIDDAYYFLTKGLLNSTIFFNLISYYSQETDYVAWYPMKNILPSLWSVSQLPESSAIKSNLINIWNELLKNVGYIEAFIDDVIMKTKRMFAIEWACNFGHNTCLESARAEMYRHINDQATEAILPRWKKVIYCAGLMDANASIISYVLRKHAQDPNAFEYVGCSNNVASITSYLQTIANLCEPISTVKEDDRVINSTIVDKNRIVKAFRFIIKKHAGKKYMLDNFLLKFMTIKPRIMSTTEALTDIIKNIREVKQLEKVKQFAETNLESDTNALTQIKELITSQSNKINKEMNEFKLRFNIEIP